MLSGRDYPKNPDLGGLRPCQVAAMECYRAFRDDADTRAGKGPASGLMAMATGTGKTRLAAELAAFHPSTLFLVHREELVDQAARMFRWVLGPRTVAVVRGSDANRFPPIGANVTIAMIQTLANRLDSYPADAFDLVIMDEAHHGPSESWRKVLEHFRPAYRLGLSATPEREDGAPLNDLFESIIYEYGFREAVTDGILVRPLCARVETGVSIDGIDQVRSERFGLDFDDAQLRRRINTPDRNAIVVDTYLKKASGVKGIAFCAGVRHAVDLAAAFRARGVIAEPISGNDPERARKLADFATGKISVLTNASILTEGFDDPSVGAILLCRPIRSKVLMAQIIGRGLRTDPNVKGKLSCLILDFADVTTDEVMRRALVTPWNIMGSPSPEAGDEEPHDIIGDPLDRVARERVIAEAYGIPATRRALGAMRELMRQIHAVDLLPPTPEVLAKSREEASWRTRTGFGQVATVRQIETLRKNNIDATGWTRHQATNRIAKLPANLGQLAGILALGFDIFGHFWTCGDANQILTARDGSGKAPAGAYGRARDILFALRKGKVPGR
jgi:superfamily II DNA or RNA helicase